MSSSNYGVHPAPPSPRNDHRPHADEKSRHLHPHQSTQLASTSYLSPPGNSRPNSGLTSPTQPPSRSITPGDRSSQAQGPGEAEDSKSPLESSRSNSQSPSGGTHLLLGPPMGTHQQQRIKRSREVEQIPMREPSTEGEMDGSADYDQALGDEARVKHRRRTSPPQLKILEHYFEINAKPDVDLRRNLSSRLNMTPREVQVWFQNRRAKIKKQKEREEMNEGTSESGYTDHRPQQSTYDRAGLQLQGSDSVPLVRRRSSVRSSGNGEYERYWDGSNHPGQGWEAPRQYFAPPPSLRYHDTYYHPNPSAVYPSPLSGASGSALPSPAQSPDEYHLQRDEYHRVAEQNDAAAYYNRRLSLPNNSGRQSATQWNPAKDEHGGRLQPRSFGSVGSVIGPPPRVSTSSSAHVNSLLAGMELAATADNLKPPEFIPRPAPLIFRHSEPSHTTLFDDRYSPDSASSVGDEPSTTEFQAHPRFYQPPRRHSPAYLYHPAPAQQRHSIDNPPPTFENYTFGVVPSPIDESFPSATHHPTSPYAAQPRSDSNAEEALQYDLINRRASCPPHLTQSFDNLGVGEVVNGGSSIWQDERAENGTTTHRQAQVSYRHSIAVVPSPSPRSLHAALSASAPASTKPPRQSPGYPPHGTVVANFSPPPSEPFSLGTLLQQQHQSLVNSASPPFSHSNPHPNLNNYERRSSALDTISESTHYPHTSPEHCYELQEQLSPNGTRRGSAWRGQEGLFQNSHRREELAGAQLTGGIEEGEGAGFGVVGRGDGGTY